MSRKLCAALWLWSLWFGAALVLPTKGLAATLTVGTDADTYVDLANPTVNFGAWTTGFVGGNVDNKATIYRGLLHFNISALPVSITIQRATLRLTVTSTFGALQFAVYRLTNGFVEGDGMTGVTWNTQPGIFPAPSSTAMSALGQVDVDIAALVKAARGSGTPNDLWLRLAPADEGATLGDRFEFATKEAADDTTRAQLIIDFAPLSSAPMASPRMLLALGVTLAVIGLRQLRRA